MNELKVFENPEFGNIRTTVISEEVYFVGKDVAECLRYADPRATISKKVDIEDRGVAKMETPSGTQEMTIINESGLYSLVLGSKLESAKKFKRWITSEVLPSIRKNGGYISGQETMTDDDLMAQALVVTQKKIESRNKVIEYQNKKIATLEPKGVFADAVSASQTSILVGDLAKMICQNGYKIGQKRLFDWLREKGYLIKRKGSDWNMPTQKSMEMGLFEIKESVHVDGDGLDVTTRTPKVTGKGQIYFINKYIDYEKGVNDEK